MQRLIAALCICLSLILVGCSENSNEIANSSNGSSTTTENDAKNASSPTAAPTPEPAAKELSLKDEGKVGDWEICVKKVAVKNKINNGKYRYFKAEKGQTYVVLTVTVKNAGKEKEKFLPYVGIKGRMIQALITSADNQEYKPTQLLGYNKDLVDKSMNTSEKKTGTIAFQIPKKAAKDKKNLKLSFEKGEEKLLYSLGK